MSKANKTDQCPDDDNMIYYIDKKNYNDNYIVL